MAALWEGYWLDPKSKDFGPNARYYQPDIAEAKKLLVAAGYPNGLDYINTYPAGSAYGTDYAKKVEILEQFASEGGFRAKANVVDYDTVFRNQYNNANGKYDGIAHRGISGGAADDAVAQFDAEYHSKGGEKSMFNSAAKGEGAGDPRVDSILEKAKTEINVEERKRIVKDLQRYLAEKQYSVSFPGSAALFELAWPVLANYGVYRGGTFAAPTYWWLDDKKAPLKGA